jgi:hypothetical protein
LFLNVTVTNLQIGAEVHGTIDGAFDSGYLMTAVVNGQLFRGVLFAPVSKSIRKQSSKDYPGPGLQALRLFLMFPSFAFHLRDLE